MEIVSFLKERWIYYSYRKKCLVNWYNIYLKNIYSLYISSSVIFVIVTYDAVSYGIIDKLKYVTKILDINLY